MISAAQIVAAGVIAGLSVAIAAAVSRWRIRWILASSIGSLLLIIAWRAISNAFGWNGDFLPAISIGDVGCLLAGAIPPAAIGATQWVPARRRWVPALVGGLIGILVNVVIL